MILNSKDIIGKTHDEIMEMAGDIDCPHLYDNNIHFSHCDIVDGITWDMKDKHAFQKGFCVLCQLDKKRPDPLSNPHLNKFIVMWLKGHLRKLDDDGLKVSKVGFTYEDKLDRLRSLGQVDLDMQKSVSWLKAHTKISDEEFVRLWDKYELGDITPGEADELTRYAEEAINR